jgi:single-strand DNA-binding protein
MNSIILSGRLGTNVELRHTNSGKEVANVRIAVDDGYGDKKETHWFTVILWEHSAKFAAEYLTKGDKVLVQGRLKTRSWEGEGGKREQVEIVADRIEPMSSPREQSSAAAVGKSAGISDEDIPF